MFLCSAPPCNMSRMLSTAEWKARSFCYVVPVPLVPVTRQAARVLRQVKLHRKNPGILSVLISDIPRTDLSGRRREPHRCLWCEFPQTTLFIIMRASSARSAWCSIVRIAWHLHDQLGVEIDRVLQLVPAVAAKYVTLHVSEACGMRYEFPNRFNDLFVAGTRSCKLRGFEARAVHSKHVHVELMLAIQRMFEQCGIDAGSLGAVKQSVWLFLGGAYHSAGLSFEMMEQVLRSNVVRTHVDFRYGVPLSMPWPQQRLSFARTISETLRQRKGLRVANWFLIWPGTLRVACLQLFGTPEAIESALEFWRAIRSNGCPSLIVIFEARADKEDKATEGSLPWEVFFRGLDREAFIEDAIVRGVAVEDGLTATEKSLREILRQIHQHRFIVIWGAVSISIIGKLDAVLSFLRSVGGKRGNLFEGPDSADRVFADPDEEDVGGPDDLLIELRSLQRTDEHHRATITSLRQENERMAFENQRMARENDRMARVVANLQSQLREQQWYHVGQHGESWWGGRW